MSPWVQGLVRSASQECRSRMVRSQTQDQIWHPVKASLSSEMPQKAAPCTAPPVGSMTSVASPPSVTADLKWLTPEY
jgi:hypothetical protein